ncbi:hypothetical protein DRQ09_01795 [candidate division KSB1 bacterium]|nr:MAG: hypothetical protein DRQ09_01795 [candidate division KSB1 bacterium]
MEFIFFKKKRSSARMKIKFSLIVLLVIFSLLISSTILFAQEQKLTKEEYQKQLIEWQQRENKAKAELNNCDNDLTQLKNQLEQLVKQIEDIKNQIYSILGTDQAGINNFISELQKFKNQLQGLVNLSKEDKWAQKDEIEGIQKKVEEMGKNKISKLPEAASVMNEIKALLGRILPLEPPIQIYVVVKGDYLWKIAGKKEIYGNPYQWIRIYTFNRDQIKDPDLIYPDQKFKIHKVVGDNEHLVAKGEWLSKIAGYARIYNDPFQWNKIYEANKSVIEDPNLIYPYMVLVIPRK